MRSIPGILSLLCVQQFCHLPHSICCLSAATLFKQKTIDDDDDVRVRGEDLIQKKRGGLDKNVVYLLKKREEEIAHWMRGEDWEHYALFFLPIQCLMYLILLNVRQIVSILFSDLFKYLQNVLINGKFFSFLSPSPFFSLFPPFAIESLHIIRTKTMSLSHQKWAQIFLFSFFLKLFPHTCHRTPWALSVFFSIQWRVSEKEREISHCLYLISISYTYILRGKIF